jgi:hypothetical protein
LLWWVIVLIRVVGVEVQPAAAAALTMAA